MVPGKFATNHFICTGEDPSNYQFLKPKVSICRIQLYFLYVIKYLDNCFIQFPVSAIPAILSMATSGIVAIMLYKAREAIHIEDQIAQGGT